MVRNIHFHVIYLVEEKKFCDIHQKAAITDKEESLEEKGRHHLFAFWHVLLF